MYRPFSFFIGFRYLRAKKRNHFISFISAISFLGVALGVAVLITVLSVMNGFDKEIRERVLVMVPQVSVTEWGGRLQNWQSLEPEIAQQKDVVGMAPIIQGQAMLSHNGSNRFGFILGVNPKLQGKISPIGQKMVAGSLQDLKPGHFGIILGKALANAMGAQVGDKITVIVPQANLTPAGMIPRLKQFKVVGIFSVGYQYDSGYALMNIKDEAKLLQMGSAISSIQLKLNNLYNAPKVTEALNKNLPPMYNSYDWTQSNSNFFKALQMEKTMMFLILALIIAVAAFNMLASLVMIVTDKQSDIAILRTLGASSRRIMGIFMVQGISIGVIGTFLGIVSGIILSLNTTEIVNWIQTVFHVQFLNANVYYINFLPSSLEFKDVWHVGLMALVLSILATIYPAWKASRVQPAEALRYE